MNVIISGLKLVFLFIYLLIYLSLVSLFIGIFNV